MLSSEGLRRYTLPVAALLGLSIGLLFPTSHRLTDALNRTFPAQLDPRIRIINIDDNALNDYGRLEAWPRELYVQAIDTLEQAGAKVIALDVVLSSNGQSDAAYSVAFSQPNLVLALAPDDEPNLNPTWQAALGVSALNHHHGTVHEFQTSYPPPGASAPLAPSFAQQIATKAGVAVALDTRPRLMRYVRPEDMEQAAIPFGDLISGNVRFANLQGNIILIGKNAASVAGLTFQDIDGRQTPGLYLQARAVSSLLAPPLQVVPTWATALLGMVTACLVVVLGGLWGYGLSLLMFALAVVLWRFNIVFPGVTIATIAVLAASLVAFERWWALRNLGTRDPLTGLGTRRAFRRAVEKRWGQRHARPLTLILIDLSGFKRINELHGRAVGDQVLRDLGQRLLKLKRRTDEVYRWGPDEFALLTEQSAAEAQALSGRLEGELGPVVVGELTAQVNVGSATTGPATNTPTELVEAASRSRYRVKYQRVQETGLD